MCLEQVSPAPARLVLFPWVVQVLLSILACINLVAQYVLVTSNTGLDHPLLPPEWSKFFRDVVGVDDSEVGGALMLSLLLPTVVLAGQYLYR